MKTNFHHIILFCLFLVLIVAQPMPCKEFMQTSNLTVARIHYQGGGDWYNDPSIIPNLCRFIKSNTHVDIEDREAQIMLADRDLYEYPLLFLTGHGQIVFSDEEAKNLRGYLLKGGFLYADDDYGMDTSFRREMKKVLPDYNWTELPFSHGIYHVFYNFDSGLPKIHEHDNQPPRGYGIFNDDGRLMVYYSYESNISDGWADPDVHRDSSEKRDIALKMGTNIILWALLN